MYATTVTQQFTAINNKGLSTRGATRKTTRAARFAPRAAVAGPTLNTTKSEAIFKAAQDILPGGVNSPVRAFKSVGGQPIVFESVKDAYAFDVDGNKYIDYVGSWGPAICGHANERVNAKLKAQIDKGTSFGAPCELENILGQMVIDRVPSVEMVRFCNSGTEALPLRASRDARLHRSRQDHQVRRLLPRSRRPVPRQGGFRCHHPRLAGFPGRSDGGHGDHPLRHVQQPR
jgi:glutamate-1-semialdehyde 2,1-aminomutase